MNVLHLVPDEKFIDFFSLSVSSINGIHHDYVVWTHEPSRPLKHIKTTPIHRIVGDAYLTSSEMCIDLNGCDVLVLHYLSHAAIQMLKHVPDRVVTVWSGWGADYYDLVPGGPQSLLGPETEKISKELNDLIRSRSVSKFLKYNLLPFYKNIWGNRRIFSAIRRVDFFSSPVPDDYTLLKSALRENFRAKYVQFFYGSLEETFAIGSCDLTGSNILVGNSATPTNNHIDVFKRLAEIDIAGKKVIAPLNYGDSKYRECVVEKGKYYFGKRFYPILDFMPLDKYNTLVASCSAAVMNHYRQQAVGNIGAILYRGTRLYINKKSVLFNFFQHRNAHVYDFDDLNSTNNASLDGLSEDKKKQNIEMLQNFWGKKNVINTFENSFCIIERAVVGKSFQNKVSVNK